MDTALPDAPPALSAPLLPVSFVDALRFWLKLGFISFGGPAGQIAVAFVGFVGGWLKQVTTCAAIGLAVTLLLPQLR